MSFGFVPEYFEVLQVAATTFTRFFSVPLVFIIKKKGLKGKCAREGVSFGFVPEYFEVPKVAATTFSRFFSVPLVFIIKKKG